jgi:hypothetical protein
MPTRIAKNTDNQLCYNDTFQGNIEYCATGFCKSIVGGGTTSVY